MAVAEWAIYIETRRPDGTRERCEIGAIRRDLSAPGSVLRRRKVCCSSFSFG
jgi:hypothetical protein